MSNLSDRITSVASRVAPADAAELLELVPLVRRMERALDERVTDAMADDRASRHPDVIPIAMFLARIAHARGVANGQLRHVLDEALT